jgi:hypothetical protein
MKPTSGAKSTEFWVVAAFLGDLIFQRFGVYEYLGPDQVMTAAEQVGQIASQLRAETGADSALVYLLAGLYVGGRILLKWRAAVPPARVEG